MLTYELQEGMIINSEETLKSFGVMVFNGGSFKSLSTIKTIENFNIPYSCKIQPSGGFTYVYYNPDINKYSLLDTNNGLVHGDYGYFLGGIEFKIPEANGKCITSVILPVNL